MWAAECKYFSSLNAGRCDELEGRGGVDARSIEALDPTRLTNNSDDRTIHPEVTWIASSRILVDHILDHRTLQGFNSLLSLGKCLSIAFQRFLDHFGPTPSPLTYRPHL